MLWAILTTLPLVNAAWVASGALELALGRWVESEGGYISDCVAVDSRGGRRGLYVTEDVKAGTELARVPKSCLICSEEADLQPAWGLSLGEFMTTMLGGARSRGEKAPYMEALPTTEALLADWTTEELSMLQSPRLEREASSQRDHRDGMVSNVVPWCPTADAPTLSWAETMVRSRALTFESGWSGTAMMCMVPFVDLANHRVPLPEEVPCFPVDLDHGEEDVVLRAPRDLATDEEVLITYGYDGNEHLLLDYGFAEAARAGQLGSETLWLDDEIALEVVHAVPEDLGLDLTVDKLTKRACSRSGGDATATSDAEAVGIEVRAALVGACEAALGAMPTTLEADQEALAQLSAGGGEEEADPLGRRAAALTYRTGQKALLVKSIEVLRRGLDGEESTPSAERRAELLDSLRRP